MEVRLNVLSGPVEQKEFVFAEPGGFTFGRADDCTCMMPPDDNTFSRHHFLLEINPSNVTLKDLGSLNGTHINDVKHGGRANDVAPEDAEASAPLSLRDGDRIRAGACELELIVDAAAICVDCGKEIPRKKRKAAEFVGGTYLCDACRRKEDEKKQAKKRSPKTKPAKLAEIELNVQQRKKAENDPAAVINELMQNLLGVKEKERPPAIQGYSDIKKVGEGGFGAVYLATRVSDGKPVAIKTMLQTRKPPRRQMMMFEREKEIAQQLRHAIDDHLPSAPTIKGERS